MKYYKREKTEYGNYVDQAGDKYTVLWCSAIYSPSKKTPEEFGYEQFDDEEAALQAWGLVPYVDPNAEEDMLLEDPSTQAEQPTPAE
jgi:hypothetical protein